jgi:hypothetical protein
MSFQDLDKSQKFNGISSLGRRKPALHHAAEGEAMVVVTMSSEDKDKTDDEARTVARAMRLGRRGLLTGFMEGFGGPAMMGTPSITHVKIVGKKGAGRASFSSSSKEVGVTIKRVADDLIRNKSLVSRKVAVKTMGADGKYHTVMTTTVGRPAAADEPRE